MADDHHESSGGSLNTNSMPEVVQMLIDAMIGINPEFSFADWLVQKASEDLSLLSSDLKRERTGKFPPKGAAGLHKCSNTCFDVLCAPKRGVCPLALHPAR